MPPGKKHLRDKTQRVLNANRWTEASNVLKRAATQLSPKKLLGALSPKKRRKPDAGEATCEDGGRVVSS